MKLNRRGKRVRAIAIYLGIALVAYYISVKCGVWDVPESCLVDRIACPEGY
jgi:hypothetical protein